MGRAILGTVAAATLAFAGCGGDDDESKVPLQPKLPPEIAAAFATESDQIAASLAAGDECAAHRQAQALRAHIGDAVGSGEVHPSLGREMTAAASSLDEGIQCEPAPTPAPEPEPAPTLTGCEQITTQLSQLRTQWEQAKQQEEAAHGQDKKAAKDLQKQLEDQAEPLIEQYREQCGGGEGGEVNDLPSFGRDENAPPGHGGDNPGQGNGNGGGGGGDGD